MLSGVAGLKLGFALIAPGGHSRKHALIDAGSVAIRTLSALFTEPIATSSIPALVTVTLTDPNTTAADQLTINGLTNGARTLGGNGYVSTNNVSYSYVSAMTFTNGNRTAVVTIGASCTGTCAAVATQATNATFSFQPAPSITDVAGNLMRTTARTLSVRLF